MTTTVQTVRQTTTINEASRQWANRPPDQRFTTLGELQRYKAAQRQLSTTIDIDPGRLPLRAKGDPAEGDLAIGMKTGDATFTNWSFGQLCGLAGAPAGYLRTLPSPMTKNLLEYGLQFGARAEQDKGVRLLFTGLPDTRTAMAFTSQSYGRIWDVDVVNTVVELNERQEGRWKVPLASYTSQDPLRATTLYASDRDVFIFLVDPDRPVDGGGEDDQLFRGFIVSNSEVGSATFTLLTFLYRYVCDNRIIWGTRDISQLTIRHSKGGPSRFLEEAAPTLAAYSMGSAKAVEGAIRLAKDKQIASRREDVRQFLIGRGFTKTSADLGLDLTVMAGGDPTNLWQVVQGLTASARAIPHQDTRVAFEREVGKLIEIAG